MRFRIIDVVFVFHQGEGAMLRVGKANPFFLTFGLSKISRKLKNILWILEVVVCFSMLRLYNLFTLYNPQNHSYPLSYLSHISAFSLFILKLNFFTLSRFVIRFFSNFASPNLFDYSFHSMHFSILLLQFKLQNLRTHCTTCVQIL